MKKLFMLLMTSLTIGASQAQSTSVFNGTWVGQGYQLNNNETWSITLTVHDGSIFIDYPSLGCNAKLTIVKSEENKLFLSEKMVKANTCIDNGKIELEWLSPNEIRYKWSFANGTPGSVSILYKF